MASESSVSGTSRGISQNGRYGIFGRDGPITPA
jgi:hypothetical protein